MSQLLQDTLSQIDDLLKSNTSTTNKLLEQTQKDNEEITALFESFRKKINDRERALHVILNTESNKQLNKLHKEQGNLQQYKITIQERIEQQDKIAIDPNIDFKQTQIQIKNLVNRTVNNINMESIRIQHIPISCYVDTQTVHQFISSIGRISLDDCNQIQKQTPATANMPKQISFIVMFAWSKKRIVLRNNAKKKRFEYTMDILQQKCLQRYTNRPLTKPFTLIRSDGQIIQTDSDIITYLSHYKDFVQICLPNNVFLLRVFYIHESHFVLNNGAQFICFHKTVGFKQFRKQIIHTLNISDQVKIYNKSNLLFGYNNSGNIFSVNMDNFNYILPKESNPLAPIDLYVGFQPTIPAIESMSRNFILNEIQVELLPETLINDFTLQVKHSNITMFTKSLSITLNELDLNIRHKMRVMSSNIFGKSKWSKWKLYKPAKELDTLIIYAYVRKMNMNYLLKTQIIELCLTFMYYHRRIPNATPRASKGRIISMILTYNEIRKRIVLKKYNEFSVKNLKQKCIQKYSKQNLSQPFDLVTENGQRIETDNEIVLYLDNYIGDIRIIKHKREKRSIKQVTPFEPLKQISITPVIQVTPQITPKTKERKLISVVVLFSGAKKRVVLKNNPKRKQYEYTMDFLKSKCMAKFKLQSNNFTLKLNNGPIIENDNDILTHLGWNNKTVLQILTTPL